VAKLEADLFSRRKSARHIAAIFREFDIVDSYATVPLYEFDIPG
jgi:hypothetical protein